MEIIMNDFLMHDLHCLIVAKINEKHFTVWSHFSWNQLSMQCKSIDILSFWKQLNWTKQFYYANRYINDWPRTAYWIKYLTIYKQCNEYFFCWTQFYEYFKIIFLFFFQIVAMDFDRFRAFQNSEKISISPWITRLERWFIFFQFYFCSTAIG